MAALLQYHGAGSFGIAPVAPYKAVRLMPVANLLNGLNRYNFPNFPAVYDLLELAVERSIPQHMTYHNISVGLMSNFGDFLAL